MAEIFADGEFADKLNRLFDTVYPPGGRPHTSAEVVAALRAQGVKVSEPYMSQLRLGRRTNPSEGITAALAAFFRIDVEYFTDEDSHDRISSELSFLASLRDEGVRRIALRTVGLSPESVQALIRAAEDLRHRDGLDPGPNGSSPRRAPRVGWA